MKAKCCPRCLTISADPEDGQIHTCTPTKAWREMEALAGELAEALEKMLSSWKVATDAMAVFTSDSSRENAEAYMGTLVGVAEAHDSARASLAHFHSSQPQATNGAE